MWHYGTGADSTKNCYLAKECHGKTLERELKEMQTGKFEVASECWHFIFRAVVVLWSCHIENSILSCYPNYILNSGSS